LSASVLVMVKPKAFSFSPKFHGLLAGMYLFMCPTLQFSQASIVSHSKHNTMYSQHNMAAYGDSSLLNSIPKCIEY
jgi:hypothetical protein